jgi:hypothetical protein
MTFVRNEEHPLDPPSKGELGVTMIVGKYDVTCSENEPIPVLNTKC